MKTHENYLNSMHKLGRITGAIALLIIIGIPVLTCWKFGIFPPLGNLMAGLSSILVVFLPISIIEVMMYAPMAGIGGSYLLFVTGNLTNLRIPALIMCMETAEVQSATEEGEIISTIAIAASALTTTIVIGLGVLLLVPLTPVLSNPILKPAFDNILPALFGALGVAWMGNSTSGFSQWKVAVLPFVLAIIIIMGMGGHAGKFIGILIPGIGAVSVLFARIMYKKGWIMTEPMLSKN
jgi:hypothetical protein